MKAIILAAGRGSRLQNLTDNKPKCLNRIGENTLLEWQLTALKSCGIEDIIVITGYKAEMIKSFGVETIYNNEWETSNMVTSLLCAERFFDQSMIVSYSDIVYGNDVVSQLCSQNEDAVVVYDKNWLELWGTRFENPLEDAESFKINANYRITNIGERENTVENIQGQYLGLMRYSAQALSWITDYLGKNVPEVNQMDMTTLIRNIIHSGNHVHGMPIYGGWCEIDTPGDLELGNRLYMEGKLKLK